MPHSYAIAAEAVRVSGLTIMIWLGCLGYSIVFILLQPLATDGTF